MEGNKNRNNNENKWLAPSVTTQTQKETIAASALLFLSPPHSLSLSSRNGDDSLSSSSSCVSDACSSTLIGAQVDQICRDPLRVLALAAFQFFLNPKVLKKSRSKNHRRKKLISNIHKMRVVYDLLSSRHKEEDDDAPAVFTLHENTIPAAFSFPEPTTLTAPSSAITGVATETSTRIRFLKKDREASSSSTVTSSKSSSEKVRASKSVKRRADDILSWLSGRGCASEVKIRTAIGDSPDTSKALRLLVKKDEVKRTGAGGRSNPFLYTVASKGDGELNLWEDNDHPLFISDTHHRVALD